MIPAGTFFIPVFLKISDYAFYGLLQGTSESEQISFFLHVRLPVYYEHLLVWQEQIAVIVAEVVSVAVFGAVKVGEVAEIESGHIE